MMDKSPSIATPSPALSMASLSLASALVSVSFAAKNSVTGFASAGTSCITFESRSSFSSNTAKSPSALLKAVPAILPVFVVALLIAAAALTPFSNLATFESTLAAFINLPAPIMPSAP